MSEDAMRHVNYIALPSDTKLHNCHADLEFVAPIAAQIAADSKVPQAATLFQWRSGDEHE